MDQVTQQNAAMVEQATAASHSLSEEAEELARLVGQFHIGQDSTPETTKPRANQSSSVRAVLTPKRQIQKSKTKFLALPSNNGSDRRLATAGAGENDWSEF
jgi:methyl-accepting chemotaxis protein